MSEIKISGVTYTTSDGGLTYTYTTDAGNVKTITAQNLVLRAKGQGAGAYKATAEGVVKIKSTYRPSDRARYERFLDDGEPDWAATGY